MANLPPVSLKPVAICHWWSLTLVGNLPPVSLTPVATGINYLTLAKLVEKFAAGVVVTGGAP